MKRTYGTGRLYVKSGAYYGRWRSANGRYRNRKIGKVREGGSRDGLTRRDAERTLRQLAEEESRRPPATLAKRPLTVDDAMDALQPGGHAVVRHAMRPTLGSLPALGVWSRWR